MQKKKKVIASKFFSESPATEERGEFGEGEEQPGGGIPRAAVKGAITGREVGLLQFQDDSSRWRHSRRITTRRQQQQQKVMILFLSFLFFFLHSEKKKKKMAGFSFQEEHQER